MVDSPLPSVSPEVSTCLWTLFESGIQWFWKVTLFLITVAANEREMVGYRQGAYHLW